MERHNIFLEMSQLRDLSPSERQVVDFVLQHPEQALELSIVALGANTFTSASTVSRVCSKLSVNGFSDFKQRLYADIQNYQEYIYINTNRIPIDCSDSLQDTMEKVIQNCTRALIDVKMLNSVDKFEKAVEWLRESKTITLYGSGVSNLICHDALMKGIRMGLPICSYTYYSEMSMHARQTGPQDLAIIVSYTGLTVEMEKIARILHYNKCKIVAITSNAANEIANLSDINFQVGNTESYYRIGGIESRTSMQCVLDIIFAGYYNKTEKAKDVSKKTFVNDTFSAKWEG